MMNANAKTIVPEIRLLSGSPTDYLLILRQPTTQEPEPIYPIRMNCSRRIGRSIQFVATNHAPSIPRW